MKYISLFSGIGGFEMGIHQVSEKMGIELECVFSSEIDKYARKIYEKNFGVEPYGDIKQINEYDIPNHNLLVGGFPCQAFSIAGKRAGFDDIRGTLFFEIARIARAKRPEILLLENVRGLLSHDKGRTFEVILKTLDDIGYDVEWQVLNSKNYGIPQNRERVFIVGHLRGSGRRKIFPIAGESRQTINQINNPTHSNNRVYFDEGISPTLNCMEGGNRQPFVIVNKEIKIRDNSTCLDANYYKGLDNHGARTGVLIKEATKQGYTESNIGDSINYSQPNSKTRRGRVSNIANTLDTGCQQGVLTEDIRIRRLTPIECERLQGFPDNWTEGLSDTQRYKCIGNAVSVPVIEAVITELFK